jgi:hypothetical protein
MMRLSKYQFIRKANLLQTHDQLKLSRKHDIAHKHTSRKKLIKKFLHHGYFHNLSLYINWVVCFLKKKRTMIPAQAIQHMRRTSNNPENTSRTPVNNNNNTNILTDAQSE